MRGERRESPHQISVSGGSVGTLWAERKEWAWVHSEEVITSGSDRKGQPDNLARIMLCLPVVFVSYCFETF